MGRTNKKNYPYQKKSRPLNDDTMLSDMGFVPEPMYNNMGGHGGGGHGGGHHGGVGNTIILGGYGYGDANGIYGYVPPGILLPVQPDYVSTSMSLPTQTQLQSLTCAQLSNVLSNLLAKQNFFSNRKLVPADLFKQYRAIVKYAKTLYSTQCLNVGTINDNDVSDDLGMTGSYKSLVESPLLSKQIGILPSTGIADSAPSTPAPAPAATPALTAPKLIKPATTVSTMPEMPGPTGPVGAAAVAAKPAATTTTTTPAAATPALGATGATAGAAAAGFQRNARIAQPSDITLPANSVTLDGSGSTDTSPLGQATSITYSWSVLSGPNTPLLTNPTSAVTQATGLVAGSYTFQLTVSDARAAMTKKTATVSVNVNPAPVAAATTTTTPGAGTTDTTDQGTVTSDGGSTTTIVPILTSPLAPYSPTDSGVAAAAATTGATDTSGDSGGGGGGGGGDDTSTDTTTGTATTTTYVPNPHRYLYLGLAILLLAGVAYGLWNNKDMSKVDDVPLN